MPRYPIVLFDFDGTLVESGPGIFRALEHMLRQMGRPPMTQEQMRPFVGPPLWESFSGMLGFSGEEMERALAYYRQFQEADTTSPLAAFPGVPQLLRALRQAGVTTAVATCKLEQTARRHARAVGIEDLLDDIMGLCPEEGRTCKADVLRALLARLHAGPGEAVLVGDRRYDCEGAREAGIPCISVLYGYGDEAELAPYRPVALVRSPQELQALLLED